MRRRPIGFNEERVPVDTCEDESRRVPRRGVQEDKVTVRIVRPAVANRVGKEGKTATRHSGGRSAGEAGTIAKLPCA